MASTIESSGAIETILFGASTFKVGETVKLVFRAQDELDPPFTVKIFSPAGKVLVERVLRELPDGKPQSAPPVQFTIIATGEYKLDISQLYGNKAHGRALIRVPEAPAPG
ncbi:MAG: hypothetical protein U0271_08835 [Polyangiaceae bacterium]